MSLRGSETARSLAEAAVAASRVRQVERSAGVVALKIDRTRAQVDACTWTSIGLGLAFTTVNVQVFASDGAGAWSPAWLVAWLLDPMVSVLLIAVLRAEQVTARWQVKTGLRVSAVKWTCFAATYAMNTWQAWGAGTARSVVLHSIPPVMVLLGAEVGPELRDRLTSSAMAAAGCPAHEEEPDLPPRTHDGPDTVREVADSTGESPYGEEARQQADPLPEREDPRVVELAELLRSGCAVTGSQASVLYTCSQRTGRRLLAEARVLKPTQYAEPARSSPGLPFPLASGPRVPAPRPELWSTP